jgi:hypothetical protein
MKLTLSVQNKVVGAYKEIMRLQVWLITIILTLIVGVWER